MLKRAFGIACSLMVTMTLIFATGCGDKKPPAKDTGKDTTKDKSK